MSSPHLVTEVQRFVDGLAEGNAKPLYEMTPQQARRCCWMLRMLKRPKRML